MRVGSVYLEALHKLQAGDSLEIEEADLLLQAILEEKLSEIQVAGLLMLMASKGETVSEIAGFARAMTRTVLGVVGGKTIDTREIEVLEGVSEVVRITAAYKLASRQFKPDGTRIILENSRRRVEVGGDRIIMLQIS